MQYRFTNITGRTGLTETKNTTVLRIDNRPVRPEEVSIFTVPTQDILEALDAGSISVEQDRNGSWVPVRSFAEFDAFDISRTRRTQRVATIDGVRFSEVTEYTITERGAAPVEPAPAPAPPPAPAPEPEPEPEVEEEVEEVEEAPEEPAEEAALSSNYSAKDAVAYINSHDLDELDGFVGDDETRKSVLKAWEAKFD